MGKVKTGIFFPSFVWPDNKSMEPLSQVRACIERCEHYGFDIWVVDHLLVAPGLYGATWLDPMNFLSYAAAITRNVHLGTAILVAPVRQPVLLAKEIASLQALSGNRFEFGIGPGWHAKEYESVGADISQRGRRTDEMIDALELLLARDNVSYEGKYYKFKDVTVYPQPGMPPVWVAGGSRVPDPQERDLPVIAESVVKRIVRAGRWLARASGKQEWIKKDWEQIRDYAKSVGKDPNAIVFGHCNWFHLTGARNREDALADQRPRFERVMGSRRDFDHLQECYLMGTDAEITERLQDLVGYGCEYLCIGPTEADPDQIDRYAREILPKLG